MWIDGDNADFNRFQTTGRIVSPETLCDLGQCLSLPSAQSDTTKRYRVGTHRDRHPRDTVDRIWEKLPHLGITRVANLTGLDVLGIPVVGVIRPNARSISVAQGKGFNLDAAKASGLMESLEVFCGERDNLYRCMASSSELKAIDRIEVASDFPKQTTSRYRKDTRLGWTLSFDLASRRPVLVPYEAVHCCYLYPPSPDSGCFSASSNGLASGNLWQEAVLHGLCEVIERDAYTLWGESNVFPWCRKRTRVDLPTIDDDDCVELLNRFEHCGFDVAIWNLTSDIDVAAFRCDIAPRAARVNASIGSGTGCHPDRGIALSRAMTEAAQHRLTLIAGSRDNLSEQAYLNADSAWISRQKQIIREESAGCDFGTIISQINESFEEDVNWILERLRQAGIRQALVVDLTLPEVGVPVVRVLIPGLEDAIGVSNYANGVRARLAESKIL